MSHTMFIGAGKRSGARGGADQFNWDKVKGDKYKDFYLGHSLHTTSKPTFNNRKPNPLWWTKSGGTDADDEARRRAEIEAIKREEEQLHLEALGLAPRRRKAQDTQLDAQEIQELTRRGNTERDAYDAERVAGLGYAPAPQHQLGMDGAPLKTQANEEHPHTSEDVPAEPRDVEVSRNEEEWEESRISKKRSRDERREEKRQRKEAKKQRKEKKKEKEKKDKRDRKHRDKHSTADRRSGRAHEDSRRRDKDTGDDKRERDRSHRDSADKEERERRRHKRSDSRSPKRRRRREGTQSPSPKRRMRHDSPSPSRS